jgi:hypothetical protein
MADVDDCIEIGRFDKTTRRQVVVEVFRRDQKIYLHVREYQDHMYPTKNGIVMEFKYLDQFIEQLEQARGYKGMQ